MGALSPLHLVLILAIALIVLGPGKLPEAGAALGKAIRNFRDAADGAQERPSQTQDATATPTTPATQPPIAQPPIAQPPIAGEPTQPTQPTQVMPPAEAEAPPANDQPPS